MVALIINKNKREVKNNGKTTKKKKNQYENDLMSTYGLDLVTYLSYIGMTEDSFKSAFVEEQVRPAMESQIVIYAIMEKEGIKFDTNKVQNDTMQKIKDAGNTSITVEQFKEYYGEHYFEEMAVTKAVVDFLYDSAAITK